MKMKISLFTVISFRLPWPGSKSAPRSPGVYSYPALCFIKLIYSFYQFNSLKPLEKDGIVDWIAEFKKFEANAAGERQFIDPKTY
jgi:hypothetical protein